jgi:pyruvate ferredoxin oxidoreductase gamma subunit
MKKDFLEVRWCGRGGQGAVTAAKMLAESALDEGKFIQAFPEFGPERMGAPVRSFTRISSKPIVVHCQIVEPDISVLLDSTLLDVVDITEGVPKNGIIIVNTTDSPEQLRQKMGLTDRKIFTVDATGISTKIMGRNVPNTPMVGAVVKVSGAVKLDSVIRNFQQEFSHKFKEEVIRTNIEAIKLAYEQTKGEGQ